MKKFIDLSIFLFLALQNCVNAGILNNNRPSHFEPNGRIIDGYPVTPHSVPHIVALTVLHADNYTIEECGACLLSNQFLVTAAHCLHDGKTIIELRFGAHNRHVNEADQVVRKSASYIIHEEFSKFTATHDIAVIKLETPVNISLPHIKPAKLPELKDINETYVDKEVQAFGWGMNNTLPEDDPDQLMGANSTVLTNEECGRRVRYSYFNKVYDYELCIENQWLKGPRGPCHGDSGGPLMYNGTLIATTSRGTTWHCEYSNATVFVNIAKHLEWIEEKMKQMQITQRHRFGKYPV